MAKGISCNCTGSDDLPGSRFECRLPKDHATSCFLYIAFIASSVTHKQLPSHFKRKSLPSTSPAAPWTRWPAWRRDHILRAGAQWCRDAEVNSLIITFGCCCEEPMTQQKDTGMALGYLFQESPERGPHEQRETAERKSGKRSGRMKVIME